ncbi:hypothetical protein OCAE111667_04100 [Occultella aeris]|uniref:Uncharacterized protein n=1 Tax=Occultella aeris TaxID=2761496 RepID=A0A7M4DG94_9MICO|nr:hypothetical protein HALOF300_01140 [Occultella aeris]
MRCDAAASLRWFADEGAERVAFLVQGPDAVGQGVGLVVGIAAADAAGNDQLRDVDALVA